MIGDEGRGRRERAEGKGRKDVRTNGRTETGHLSRSRFCGPLTHIPRGAGGPRVHLPRRHDGISLVLARRPTHTSTHEHCRARISLTLLFFSLYLSFLSLSFLRFLPAVPAHGGHTQIKCNGSARCPYGTSLARRYRHCCQPCRRRHHHRRPTDDDDDGAAPRSPTDGHHARADADA